MFQIHVNAGVSFMRKAYYLDLLYIFGTLKKLLVQCHEILQFFFKLLVKLVLILQYLG
jgi:hypothetical protein